MIGAPPRSDERLTQQGFAARQTLCAPHLTTVVILAEAARPGRDQHPRLLGLGVDVHVGRQTVRFIERADANETHDIAEPTVVTPYCNLARRAACDRLSLATVARCRHELRT